jgi:hypothetical protein
MDFCTRCQKIYNNNEDDERDYENTLLKYQVFYVLTTSSNGSYVVHPRDADYITMYMEGRTNIFERAPTKKKHKISK